MQLNMRIHRIRSVLHYFGDDIIFINHLHQSSGAELRVRLTGGRPLPLGDRRIR